MLLAGLIVSPQVWWGPMLDWRIDFIVYPTWALILVMRGRFGEVFKFQHQDKFFLWMYVWIVLSVVTNGINDIGTFHIFTYLKWFVVYRFVCASIADLKDLQRAGYAFMFLALFIAIEGIQHQQNPSGLGWAGQSYAWIDGEAAAAIGLKERIRWVGIFDGPGVFCVLFTAAIPFAFQYMVSPYALYVRALVSVFLTTPLLMAAYFTGSRGGILATAAMVGMFLVSRFKISLGKLILAVLLGIVALAAAPSYLTETKDSNKSAQGRVDMWAKGMEMVETNPVFGIGKGQFGVYTQRLVAHNSALEVMGETGFVGMFFWISLIYLGFKALGMRIKETDNAVEKQAVLAVMMSLAGYLVSSLFVSLETEVMYFILGMTAAVARFTTQPVKFTRRDAMVVAAIQFSYYGAFKVFIMGYY